MLDAANASEPDESHGAFRSNSVSQNRIHENFMTFVDSPIVARNDLFITFMPREMYAN